MTYEQIELMAQEVYAELGSGYSEAIYQKACEVWMRQGTGEPFDSQIDVPVLFRGRYVGRGIMDLVVPDGEARVVIELKAVAKVGEAEVTQLKNYLRLEKCEVGVLINFGQPGAQKAGELSVLQVAL